MTTVVEPSSSAEADPSALANAIRAAHGDYIKSQADGLYAEHDNRLGAVGGEFNLASQSGLDVTISDGEAYIGGHWLATDQSRTVTLQDNTSNQTVYLGVDRSQTHTILLGLDSAFVAPADPRIAIHEFDTSSGSVTGHTSLRPIGSENASYQYTYTKGEADDRFLNVDTGGLEADLDFQQHRTVNRALERRSSRPSNPVEWQEWVRTDTDPQRHEIYTPLGYRKYDIIPVHPIIDDYEHDALSTYYTSPQGRIGSTYETTAGAARTGAYGLHVDGTNHLSGEMNSYPGDGLDNYPAPGETIEFWTNWQDTPTGMSNYADVYFGMQGSQANGYRIRFNNGSDLVALFVIDGGSQSTLGTYSPADLSQPGWYRNVLEWGLNGEISLTVYRPGGTQDGQLSADDSTHSSEGGWGYYATGNGVDYFIDDITSI